MFESDNHSSAEERRRAPRVKGAVVEYFTQGDETSKKKAFIKDVSLYGVCIYVLDSVKVGETLGLDIYLFGNEAPLRMNGKVVWRSVDQLSGYKNLGIEFIGAKEDDKQKLSDHIDYCRREEGGCG